MKLAPMVEPLRFADTGERMDEGLRIRHTGLFRYNFTASEYQADLAESWEWSNENRTLTIKLREGLKWSDGDDYTTEDVRWHWEDVLNDPDVSPSGPGGFWSPGGEDCNVFEIIDDYTFSYGLGPFPTQLQWIGSHVHTFPATTALYGPSHYLKASSIPSTTKTHRHWRKRKGLRPGLTCSLLEEHRVIS